MAFRGVVFRASALGFTIESLRFRLSFQVLGEGPRLYSTSQTKSVRPRKMCPEIIAVLLGSGISVLRNPHVDRLCAEMQFLEPLGLVGVSVLSLGLLFNFFQV